MAQKVAKNSAEEKVMMAEIKAFLACRHEFRHMNINDLSPFPIIKEVYQVVLNDLSAGKISFDGASGIFCYTKAEVIEWVFDVVVDEYGRLDGIYDEDESLDRMSDEIN